MHEVLLQTAALVALAKLAEALAVRMRLSPLAGWVAAGLLLGPVAGWAHPSDGLSLLASLGLALLFFLVGADEMDPAGVVRALRGRTFLAVSAALLPPFAAGLWAASHLGLPVPVGIVLAGVLALTSLGVVATVLSDAGALRAGAGLHVFTLVAVLELALLLVVGSALRVGAEGHAFGWAEGGLLAARIVGFAAVAWTLAAWVMPWVLLRLRRWVDVPQLALGVVMGGLLAAFVLSEEAGLHGSLGALLFGMALSGLPRSLRSELLPPARGIASGLFVPLFFATAGLRVDASFLDLPLMTVAVVLVAAVPAKAAGAALAGMLAPTGYRLATAAGLMGKGVAELALLVVMAEAGLIGQPLFALLSVVMLGYILLAPASISWAARRAQSGAGQARPVPPSYARYALTGLTAADAMGHEKALPHENLTLAEFMERWTEGGRREYAVAKEDGTLAGVFPMTSVQDVPRERWAETPIARLLRRRGPVASPDVPLDEVLEAMAIHRVGTVPVVDADSRALLGEITSSSVVALLGSAPAA
jgi:Kef-type K+ transport system membrane component KefB/CBS domain-containing protein